MDTEGPRNHGRTSIFLILLMLMSVWLPVPVANAAIQIENRDLGVLTDLHDALDVRGGLLADDGESASAESAMASVDAEAIKSETEVVQPGENQSPGCLEKTLWGNVLKFGC